MADAIAAPASLFAGHPWEGVARILDREPTLAGLRAHRMQLLAGARLRERGLHVPDALAEEVRLASISILAAVATLRRIAAVVSGPVLVIKGPEVGAHYPAAGLRPFTDLDILVPNAEKTQGELLSAGFELVGPELDWSKLHHMRQVSAPDHPAVIEVHRRPRWIRGLPAPDVAEIVRDAVPSALGVDGILAPRPAMHAVLLLANAWSERPLERLGDLVDAAAVCGDDGDEASALAVRFGLSRAWRAAAAATEALFGAGPPPAAFRTWARNLPEARGRTVFESHVARLAGPLAGLPPGAAIRNSVMALQATIRPLPGETWGGKLERTRKALSNAPRPRAEHERMLEDERRARP